MSVLIKGLDMPANCGECFALKAELYERRRVIYCCCFIRKEYQHDGKRMKECPLVELPPHGRLIDADEIINGYEQDISRFRSDIKNPKLCREYRLRYSKAIEGRLDIISFLKSRPTIIEAEEET